MKFYLGLLGLFLALGLVKCGEPPEEVKKLIDECAKETGATLPKGLPNFDDAKTKCFAACMMKKDRLLADGKIVIDKSLAFAAKHFPEGGSDSVKAYITECANKANEGKEECEVAGSLYKCMMDKYPH